ncbi:MAG TPA: von Willebrand factor type A domain-containing protein, partial [Candidatus Paceibacterota bacterium]|nr:von Willebrand factor type A domain-containing protein [Candidatus Paceibacterota bacterium]
VSGLNYGIAQKGSAANRVAGTEERLRSLYDSAGVSLDKSRGETVTVNDETGDITVLANPKKVETIGAIETLNTPQPNVNGQARFVETNQSENKGLGFDWYQGNQISTTSGRVFRSINPDAGGAAASATHGGHVAGVIAGEIPQGNVVSPSEPVQATNLYFDSGVAVGGTGFGGAMRHGQGMPIFGDVPRVGRAFAAAPPVAGLPPSASDTSKFYSMNLGKNFEGTAKSGGGGIGGGGGGGDSFARDIPRVSASKSAQVANSGSIRTKAEVDALIKVKESELAALGPSPLADADPMSTSPTPTITPEVAAQLTSHLDKMRESARQQEIEFKKLKSQGAGTTSEEILIAKKSRLDQTTAQIGALESRLDQAKIYVLKESNYAKTKQELAQLRQLRERFGADQSDIAPAKPAQPAPIPQPEILTRENAFSTFSLNVSDVSFKLAATSLERGVLPDAASIRSEEFINAFDYRDPEPTAGAPIAFNSERARYPFAHNRDLLRFSVKTAAAGRQPGRPLNLVLLLDNSGSMERADRVRIIREALRVLAKQLQPQDRFSVVTFSRTAQLRVDGLTGDHAGEVIESLSNLTPEGGTNLEEAMNLAYATALKHYLANGVNRVVLLTDGAANLGNVQPETLKQKVEANRKQGIAFDCFGIGWEGYNDDLLEVLSRNGDGRYGFLNTPEEASSQFAAQLAGALKVAASDVKVQVEFNPKRVTSYRQIGYAKHQLTKEQFRDNTVDAAEIGASESGNALYTVEVNPAGSGPLCTVRVRFKVPGTSDYREHSWDVPYTGSAVALEQASPAMRLAASASAFSEWLAASPFAGEFSPDELLRHLNGVPEVYGADARPKKLEWMIRQAKSIGGK